MQTSNKMAVAPVGKLIWQKQYPYKVGRKKVYLPPSEAEKHGYERVNKYPKSTKYGRQNPISERWNSEEQLVLWRAAWADVTNRHLETAGHEERIDHRSHADRGLTEQPTIHEGVVARALEKKGIVSDRCELNRQIKADNKLLRELKTTVKKLMQAVKYLFLRLRKQWSPYGRTWLFSAIKSAMPVLENTNYRKA